MRFRSFLIGLVLVGLVASLYSAPKTLFMSMVFEGTPAPYNTGWVGTSELARLLRRQGYNVYAPTAWDRVEDIVLGGNYTRYILVFISPEKPITSYEASRIASMLQVANISILVADEAETSNELLGYFGARVTGERLEGPEGSGYIYASLNVPVNGFSKSYMLQLSIASGIDVELFRRPGKAPLTVATETISLTQDGVLVGAFIRYTYLRTFGRVAVFGDGTIFLNTALRHSTPTMNYTDFALAVFSSLSMGANPNDIAVVLDTSHYHSNLPNVTSDMRPEEALRNYVQAPLPIIIHPSMIVFLAIWLLRALEKMYFEALSTNPAIGVPIIAAISYLVYRGVMGNMGVRMVNDDVIRSVEETSIVAETPLRTRLLKSAKLSRREALEALYNLSVTLDYLLEKHLNVSLRELVEDPGILEAASRVLQVEPERLQRLASKLMALRERYEGVRRFTPIVFRWNALVRKMVYESEGILEKLGYTLIGEKEGYKGVEYGVRKY